MTFCILIFFSVSTNRFLHASEWNFWKHYALELVQMPSFWLLWTAFMENDVTMRVWTIFHMSLPPIEVTRPNIFKYFHPSHNTLFHGENHKKWDLYGQYLVLVWEYACVFLFAHSKGFDFSHYPHMSSSPQIILNKILTFSYLWIFLHTSSCYLWDFHRQVPCCKSLEENKTRESQKCFLVQFLKCAIFSNPSPINLFWSPRSTPPICCWYLIM